MHSRYIIIIFIQNKLNHICEIKHVVTTPSTPCSDGDTRLENSTYLYSSTTYSYGGRVEVCYSGIYHPVCDEGWTDNDAVVVCNSVGYSSDFYRKSHFWHSIHIMNQDTL